MLPKSKRLTAKEFKGLRTKVLYRGAFFDVAAVPATSVRFACVVAKKRIRRAVDRNTARRRVYSLLSLVSVSSPMYVVVYPTKNILSTPYSTLSKEITTAFATL